MLQMIELGAYGIELGAGADLGSGGRFERPLDFGQLQVEGVLTVFGPLDFGRRARQIFLGGDVGELTLVRLLSRAIERGADFRDARAKRVVLRAELLVVLLE